MSLIDLNPSNIGGDVTIQGSLTIATVQSTDNPLSTTSNKRTGSFVMLDGTGPASLGSGTDLDFGDEKMFILEAYVEVKTNTPTNDVWSNYRLVGINESLVVGGTDAWKMTVDRRGDTDPLITFDITAAGQVQYTTPTYAATFVHAHIYYEIVSNII